MQRVSRAKTSLSRAASEDHEGSTMTPMKSAARDQITTGFGTVTFDPETGNVDVAGLGRLDIAVWLGAARLDFERAEVTIDSNVLRRIVQHLNGGGASARLTWDLFTTGNAHVYVRLEAAESQTLDSIELPRVTLSGAGSISASIQTENAVRWGVLEHEAEAVAVVVKKYPWLASWNDVGAYAHRTLADSELIDTSDGALRVATSSPITLEAGQTVESAILLRKAGGDTDFAAAVREEAVYSHPDETRYVPEGEFRHQRVWENEDVWLGPPITEGAMQRPYDQLIPRPLGLNVLARKRFTWSNEDFSLWRLTGKDHYWESGVKKAVALMATQNEHGGWYEGVEFYNLPPSHHEMYDTYISGIFLLDAYDATGHQEFLEAAGRAVQFWLNPPPANGHVEVADGAWWYRWGGYINEFGYTDERCVLNTHSGATAFLAMYAERTGDKDAKEAAEAGIAAMRWGLERGIQRGNGQFLYCLSQVDPTLERPGDPPYIKLDLVPQIEDVYTVASSYRLLMALRTIPDPEVIAAIRRALDYWWTGHRAGTVTTYRAYATIVFGVAAGEIDLRYALALPEILRDPQQFTSMQRGLSAFIAPHGLSWLHARVEGAPAHFVEPVFVRRRRGEFLFALVNVEQPVAHVPVHISLPEGVSISRASVIDPASASLEAVPTGWREISGGVALEVDELQEFAVRVVHLDLEGPDA